MSDKCGSLCPKFMFLDYYDLVSVSKIIVASHSTTQVAVTLTINTEQVYRCIN